MDDIEFKALVHYWDCTDAQVAIFNDRIHNSVARRLRRSFEAGVGALTVNQWILWFEDAQWDHRYAKTVFIDTTTADSHHHYRIYQGWRPNTPCYDVRAEAWITESDTCPPPELHQLPIMSEPVEVELRWVG